MTEHARRELLSLPDELIRSILDYVHPRSLASLQVTCHRLNKIGADPRLWESACLLTYRWWDKHHEFELKQQDRAFKGWKRIFADRWKASRRTERALTDMVRVETHRLDRLKEILDSGYDAKDELIRAYYDSPLSETYLAQR